MFVREYCIKSLFVICLDTCNSDLYFTCVQDKGCVLKDYLCNGLFDCEDQSDETTSAMCRKLTNRC